MIDYCNKYKKIKIILLTTLLLTILLIIFLIMNIKIRNNRIWELEIEKESLKEIIEIEKMKEEENENE